MLNVVKKAEQKIINDPNENKVSTCANYYSLQASVGHV